MHCRRLFATVTLAAMAIVAHASPVSFPGTTVIGTTSTALTVSVVVTAPGQLGSVGVLTGGVSGLAFGSQNTGNCTKGTNYLPGQSCNLPVTFQPIYPGQQIGAVVLFDTSGNPMGSTWLVATGTGPLALFTPGIINTVAGDLTWNYNGDGLAATSSSIFLPFGVAVDPAGNFFIADSANDRIRRVDAVSQKMSTVAGNGSAGNTGDGGLATLASLSSPNSVVLDGAGNLYIADSNNHAVRMVNIATGIITTIAGVPGVQGYQGDGGLATLANLNTPDSIAIDPINGYLYIADTGNSVIRKLNLSTGIISAFAGNHTATYAGDGGPATSASLNTPWSVTVGPSGQVYIADSGNHSIRLVALDGTISTIAGSGTSGFSGDGGQATSAALNSPAATALDVAGNLYISDSSNNRVRKINAATGVIDTVVGSANESFSGDGGDADQAGLYGPYALAIDGTGNLFVADVLHNRIRKVNSSLATQNFPAMRVQRVSATQNETLENDGNAPLNISQINPSVNAQLDPLATTCSTGAPLASATDCILGTQFAPTVTGNSVQGTITITSNSPNSPQKVTLAGKVMVLDPATITLSTSGSPSSTGALVTFTTTVTVIGTGATPTGTVTFLDGTRAIGTAILNTAGAAQFATTSLTPGSHTITVSYPGDTNTSPIVSSAITEVVKDGTTTALTSSLNPSSPQSSVSLTAIVTGASIIPTGTVTFKDGSTVLGTVSLDGTGSASLTVLSFTAKTHTITAAYSGSTNSNASTSSLSQLVVASGTTTSLIGSSTDVTFGATVGFTATVSATNGGTPTGTVTFKDGATTLANVTLTVGTAVYDPPLLSVGPHSISAAYAGDSNNAASTSGPASLTIEPIKTTTTLVTAVNPAPAGAIINLTATITAASSVPSSPVTGLVTFMEGATTLGTGTVNANVATLKLSSLSVGPHSITAIYGGAQNYSGSTSVAISQAVQQATTSGSLIASVNPAIAGANDTLTVTITSNGGVPSGTVKFMDGATLLGTAALNAQGVANFPVPAFSTGNHSITAVYSGDSNNLGTTPTLALTVNPATTSVVLASSGSPSIAGVSVTLSATVKGTGGSPNGFVTFYDGTTILGSEPINNAGLGTISSSSLAVGPHNLTATYTGDTNDNPSTSPIIVQAVVKTTTTTSLTATATTVPQGAPMQFTATVNSNVGTPAGNIQFMDGSTVIGSVVLSANGIATLPVSNLIVGQHIITASYPGDTNDGASNSTSLTLIIQPITTVALASNQNPSSAGANVTFTVAISGSSPAPTGAVTFKDGSAVLGAMTLNSAGVAVFNTTNLALGTHLITASYGGDTNNNSALSQTLSQLVQRATTQTAMSVSATSATINSPVNLTVSVSGSGGIPGGQVIFLDGTTPLGTVNLSANGAASLTLSNLPLGQHTITASYLGDTNDIASTSQSQILAVSKGAPTLTLVSSSNPAVAGLPVSFTANLSGAAGAPTGSITFADGSTVLGASPIGNNGSATYTTSTLSVGQHNITASYLGDSNNNQAASAAIVQTIQQTTSAITLLSSKNPALIGDLVTYTMAVTGTGAQPIGTVTLRDGANTVGTVSTDTNGLATMTLSNLSMGAHTLIASYAGDASHPGSQSAPLLQTILQPTSTSITASSNPSFSGAPVVFTAIVTSTGGNNVTGTVTFRDGSTLLGTGIVGASGVASFSASFASGQHSIVATYSGDSVSQISSSPVLVQTVRASNTTTVLSTSGTPSPAGGSLTFSALVTGKGTAPTGSVNFEDGTSIVGTSTIGTNGIATLTTSSLAAGQHILIAIYQGDANNQTSTSNPVLQNVEQRTTVALTASANPALIGNTVTFNVAVTSGLAVGLSGGQSGPIISSTPTGIATLSDGSTILGTSALNSSGAATFSISALTLGTHTLTASYAGDAQNFAATSPALTVTIQLHPSTNTLTVSSASIPQGQPLALVATLRGDAAVPPSGTVVFSSGGTTFGSATLNASGIATLTVTPDLGTYNIIATYQGDALYTGSVSSASPVQVVVPTNFTVTLAPPTLQLQSTQHSTIQLTLTSIQNFTDVLSLGCVGLPRAATCTFSADQVTLAANGNQTISLTIDSGSPLTAGSIAKNESRWPAGITMCLLPGSFLLGLSLFRARKANRLLTGLLLLLLAAGSMAISGCGGIDVHGTPAGTYTFNVTAIGSKTAITQSAVMTLTVTQ